MSFIPASFGNFGKSTKDLFKKKYDFDYGFKSVRRSPDGLTFESSLTQAKDGNSKGAMNIKGKCSRCGEVEVNVTTDRASENKASWKLSKVKGLTTTVAASTKDDDLRGDKPVFSLDTEYVRQNVAVNAVLKSNCDKYKLKTSAAVGVNDFSVGASTAFDLTGGVAVTDYNVGAEYSKRNYSVSAVTERKMENVILSYFHRPAAGYVFGARVTTDLALQNPKLTLGAETKLNDAVTLKLKVDSDTTVSAALEQRLRNPSMQVGVAATFKPLEFNQSVKAGSFGFNVVLGDY